VDARTDEPIDQAVVSASDGQYSFVFNQVTEGGYLIIAGTDSDDDGFICDSGEACGAFRTLDSPDVLEVTNDTVDADFISGFRFNLVDPGATSVNERRTRGYRITKQSGKDGAHP